LVDTVDFVQKFLYLTLNAVFNDSVFNTFSEGKILELLQRIDYMIPL